METMKISLTQRQRRDKALRQQGLSPVNLGIKPGIRVEKDRKAEAKRGVTKHKKDFCLAA
jgi:hypothetical protein